MEEVTALQNEGHVVYFVDEILDLETKTPEEIRAIHQAKKRGPGKLVKDLLAENARDTAAEREAIQQSDNDTLWDIPDASRVEVGASFPTPEYELVAESVRLETLLPRILAAPFAAIDTETTGLDPLTNQLRLIQIAIPDLTAVVDSYTCPVRMLEPLFNQRKPFIFHNAGFDLQFLTGAGLPWPQQLFDTMLASQLLGAGSTEGQLNRSGLAAVALRYLGLSLPKEEQRSRWDKDLRTEQVEYAARDAGVLLPLCEKLNHELRAADLKLVMDIENQCVPALAWLELAGLPIDGERWLARASQEEARVHGLETQLHSLIGRDITRLQLLETPLVNWQSPAQALEVLRSRGHQIAATDSGTLVALDDPLAMTLIEYRDAVARASTYGREWLSQHQHPATGRIHASYLQCGSAAGRMSCTKPNAQNLPRSEAYRSCVRPEEGRCLVKADYSQIELRIAAVVAKDRAMLAAYQARADLHKLTASRVLGIPADEVNKDHRQLAKALNFGLLYGMGAKRLRDYAAASYGVSLSEGEAVQSRGKFFETYPGLKRWHRKTGALLEHAHELETRTLTGRRRLGVQAYTVALNTPIQGSGADGLKAALSALFIHREEAPTARLVAVVHDEVVAECRTEDADQTALWLKKHMTATMREIVADAVPIEVETIIGQDWSGTPIVGGEREQ